MKTKIIIVTGKAQSGKDTGCAKLREFIKVRGLSSKVYSFAEPLKDFCINVLGLTYNQCWGENTDKDTLTHLKWNDLPLPDYKIKELSKASMDLDGIYMSAREVMQVWGSEICRKFDPDCWVRSAFNKIKTEGLDVALIADARFPNEIEFALQHNPIVVRLTRNILNKEHISEVALDNYDFSKIKNFHLLNNDELSLDAKNKVLEDIISEYLFS